MCLFAGASVRETALSSKNGKLRSEKDVWMDFRTGVQFPSPPPEEEASNSSSSRMSSRLCIDLGMPFRASPFRFPDVVFCVLRRFKPEEVLVYPSGFFVA